MSWSTYPGDKRKPAEQVIVGYPRFIADITGILSVRVGARVASINTTSGVVKVPSKRILSPTSPSAFDLADIVDSYRRNGK